MRDGRRAGQRRRLLHPAPGHAALALLAEQGVELEDEVVLRRVVAKDGRSRATVNDQPVSVGLLRRAGALLVEVQGQHDQMGLADPAGHAALLDSFADHARLRRAAADRWAAWRAASRALETARTQIAEAAREEEWLRHATDELATLAPEEGEEDRLAAERQRLQQGERRAEAIAAAVAEIAPRDRRNPGPAAALRAASRALQRLGDVEAGPAGPALAALDRAEEALGEAESLLTRLADEADADPRLLERAEERLFALRAAARKHGVPVVELPALLASAARAAAGAGQRHRRDRCAGGRVGRRPHGLRRRRAALGDSRRARGGAAGPRRHARAAAAQAGPRALRGGREPAWTRPGGARPERTRCAS